MLKNNGYNQQDDFNKYCNQFDATFNSLAEQRELTQKAADFFSAANQADKFHHAPFLAQQFANLIDMISGEQVGSFLHTGIEHGFAYKEYQEQAHVKDLHKQFSSELLWVINHTGQPKTLAEALAYQFKLSKIRAELLDESHYKQFVQISNEINTIVEKFSAHSNLEQFDQILKQNKALQAQQGYFIGLQVELQRLALLQGNKLANTALSIEEIQKVLNELSPQVNTILHNMPTTMQVIQIQKLLEQYGITTTSQFKDLLANNAFLQESMSQVLSYLTIENQEKSEEKCQQLIAANYQGLQDAFHFVDQIAAFTECKELAGVVKIAQAGVHIYHAVSQIQAIGLSGGLALLSPMSAIGIAALSVFTLFQKTSNPNQALMQQLASISKQINYLHKDLIKGINFTNKNIVSLLEATLAGFEHINYLINVPVARQLSDIQTELKTLCTITKTGFEELILKDLYEVTHFVDQIINERIPVETLSQPEYTKIMLTLCDYLLQRTSSDLLTGLAYKKLLDNPTGGSQQVIEILKDASNSKYLSLLGLLIYFAKYNLKVDAIKHIDEKSIFQPELWLMALCAYSDCKLYLHGKFSYDPKGKNLLDFQHKSEQLRKFVFTIQNNNEIYSSLFNNIINHSQILLQQTNHVSATFSTQELNGLPITLLNDDLNQFTVSSIGQLPLSIQTPNSDSHSKKYHNLPFLPSKQEVLQLIVQKGFLIPSEFLFAEKLGIGHFECHIHYPSEMQQNDKHCSYSAGKAGMTLNYVCNGQCFEIFKPASISSGKNKNAGFKETLKSLVISSTQSVFTIQSINELKTHINQYLVTKKKAFAQKMLMVLADNPVYHQLCKLNHFLLAYLACAGFPMALREQVAKQLLLVDYFTAYQHCSIYGNELPIINIQATQIQQISIAVQEYVSEAKRSPSNKCYFQSSLVSQSLDAILLRLQILSIFEGTLQQQLINHQLPLQINNSSTNIFTLPYRSNQATLHDFAGNNIENETLNLIFNKLNIH